MIRMEGAGFDGWVIGRRQIGCVFFWYPLFLLPVSSPFLFLFKTFTLYYSYIPICPTPFFIVFFFVGCPVSTMGCSVHS